MGCKTSRGTVSPYVNLTDRGKKVTTSVPQAQLWFDRGLMWLYGYNHDEAVKCFKRAIKLDEKLAMGYWGIGYALGANYNFPRMIDAKEAYSATQSALKLARDAKLEGVERGLIEALAQRYEADMLDMDEKPEEAKEQLNRLHKSYADAMGKVYTKYCQDIKSKDDQTRPDPDVAALYVEALMNRKPWHLWELDEEGEIPSYTLTSQIILENFLKIYPKHPALCHLYVHLMELSKTPQKALPQANTLVEGENGLIPGSGHLLHMASHIDMLVGDYLRAIEANKKAFESDELYVQITKQDSGYYLGYRVHNLHFLAWAAMFDGQYKTAIQYARYIQERLPLDKIEDLLKYLESYCSVHLMVLTRFGKWDEILKEPMPEDKETWVCVAAMSHYARAIAYAAKGMVKEAKKEKKDFFAAVLSPSMEGRLLHNNVMWDKEGKCGIFNVAAKMMEGEILYRERDFKQAFEALRKAVKLEDALHYDEPWGWMQPTRHALGALLNEQKRYQEAQKVFEEDLKKWPKNLWSTRGLADSHKGQGNAAKAKEYLKLTKKLAKRADVIQKICFLVALRGQTCVLLR